MCCCSGGHCWEHLGTELTTALCWGQGQVHVSRTPLTLALLSLYYVSTVRAAKPVALLLHPTAGRSALGDVVELHFCSISVNSLGTAPQVPGMSV